MEIIEKIDIGGISLIRAAAKNYNDVLVVSGREQYTDILRLLEEKQGHTSISDRRLYAAKAFQVSSHYDTVIFNYFNREESIPAFMESINISYPLRYGEIHIRKEYFTETSARFSTNFTGRKSRTITFWILMLH